MTMIKMGRLKGKLVQEVEQARKQVVPSGRQLGLRLAICEGRAERQVKLGADVDLMIVIGRTNICWTYFKEAFN